LVILAKKREFGYKKAESQARLTEYARKNGV